MFNYLICKDVFVARHIFESWAVHIILNGFPAAHVVIKLSSLFLSDFYKMSFGLMMIFLEDNMSSAFFEFLLYINSYL